MDRMNSMGLFKSFATGLMMLLSASLSVGAMAKDKVIEATVESKILKQERKIVISLPEGYEKSKQSYPVMYLLDGSSHIEHISSSGRYLAGVGAAPGIIIVGIDNVDRLYDLTPLVDEEVDFKTGGGDRFLDFIDQELKPYINNNYRTVDYSIFTGHSLGGLMTVYALIKRPEIFNAYFSFSPSLWFKQEQMMAMATEGFKNNPYLNKYLYVNLGNEQGGMIKGFDAFEKILKEQGPKSLGYKLERYPNETHMSIPLIGQVSAYRALYANWQMSRDMFDSGAQGVIAFYKDLSKTFGYEITPDENDVNSMAYYLLTNDEKVDIAVELFELNVKNYPESANVYDSLAQGYEKQGKLKKALKMVSKAVAMSKEGEPGYKTFVEHKAKVEALLSES